MYAYKLFIIYIKPIFIRKDTAKDFQWRIRNLNFPKENFLVELDKNKDDIVIKTVNKKYYKRYDIPDLKRLKIPLDENNLKINFQNNTLIISVIIHILYIISIK